MRITSVSYRGLRSGPNFSNTAIEATAEIEPGELPELVLGDVKAWVDRQFSESQEVYKLRTERNDLQAEIERSRRAITVYAGLSVALLAWLKAPSDVTADLLKAAGKPLLDDEMPF